MSTENVKMKNGSLLLLVSQMLKISNMNKSSEIENNTGENNSVEAVDHSQKIISLAKGKKVTNSANQEHSAVIKKPHTPRLIDVLIEHGVVDKGTIEHAIEIQHSPNEKRRLMDVLIEECGVDPELLFNTVARFYSFETVDTTFIFGDKDKIQFIKQLLRTLCKQYYEIAIKRKILPFELYVNGYNKLIIVTPDTTHPDVHVVAKAFSFPKYEVKHITIEQWNELWRQLAFDQGAKQLGLDNQFNEIDKDEYELELTKSLEEEVGNNKLGELIESIMVDGVRTGASDIHVIPKATLRTEFHFRIDGQLTLWTVLKDVRAEAILSVVKDRGKNLDRFEKFQSQDGFAQRTIDNNVIRFRFSTMPIYGGDIRSKLESVVIRILRNAETLNGIDGLGMDSESQAIFDRAVRKPQGMIIFTGPTGSGKSTSQVAAIKAIMDPRLNIITIEDPVEYLIEGTRQVKLNHKLDFEGALRGLLRHDPDIVMVGEMRDKVTADLGVKLANTGHLIFSTLHTNDSISAITRLYNMGIEPFLLAYSVNIVVAQRLVRKLCDRCKAVDTHVDEELLLNSCMTQSEIENTTFYKPVGCAHCIKGYRGRVGIFEILSMTKEMRKIILKSKDFVDEDTLKTLAIKNGMKTLRDSALRLVKDGVTSIESAAGLMMEE